MDPRTLQAALDGIGPDHLPNPGDEDQPPTIHGPDLFFMDSTRTRHTNSVSSQLYPYHQQAFVHSSYSPPPIPTPPNPYVHQPHHQPSLIPPPPPLPPKPIVYPSINSNVNHENYQVIHSSPPLPPPPLPSQPLQDEVVTSSPSPVEDSDELAMALALSQSESVQKRLLEEQLINQEQEDLVRALAASMLPSGTSFLFLDKSTNQSLDSQIASDSDKIQASSSHMPLALPPNNFPSDIPSSEDLGPSISHDAYAEFGYYDKWRIPTLPEKQQERETPRIVAQARSESATISSVSSLPYDTPPSTKITVKRSSTSSVSSLLYTMPGRRSNELPKYSCIDSDNSTSQKILFPGHLTVRGADLSSDLVTSGDVLEFDDATYARQLAAEEEELLRQSLQSEGQQDGSVDNEKSASTSYEQQKMDRPQSGRTISHEELYGRQYPETPITSATTSTFSSMVQSVHSTPPVSDYDSPDYNFPSLGRAKSYQSDIQLGYPENQNPSQFAPVVYPSLGNRRGSAQSEPIHNPSPPPSHTEKPQLRLDVPQLPATSDARRHSQTRPQSIATTSATSLNQMPLSSSGVLNVNHFVDHELLRGVSIGFKSPMISTRLVQMQNQMPNIISLPYTRCPPLHIQAPDWRHLLRLMARLSGTRIEPTVNAMAVSKTELKLRTVIQFVKPHPSHQHWRSVLWFTIDQPVPSSVHNASRYTAANPNLLPWSYTLSPIPVLLRDASDTNMSKTYTIPATDTIPLPTLPITFPNLALYLQAVLDTSRQHVSDSPQGLGKLCKMIETCYPNINENHSEYDIPERTRVSHLFKRVIGLNSRDKKKGKGTHNEDTYQLVTPFVPDEWG